MVAYLFPGQGSQAARMGEDLLSAPWAKEIVAASERESGLPLRRIILEEPGQLMRTSVAQPAILLVEWLSFQALKRAGREPQAVAGHSLGEFAALAAAGTIPWPVALRLVAARGRLMEEAAQAHPGGMLAVLGLTEEEVTELARKAGCFVANYNAPGQTVLTGKREPLAKAAQAAQESGGKAVPLKVAGPFHSPYMAEAEEKLARLLSDVDFKAPKCTFISSVSGKPESDPARIAELLARQMTSPVRWTEVLRSLNDLEVTEAWEVGPGEVLSRLGKRAGLGIRFLALKEVMDHV
jgi:[acyl-carrier-protein] S-malonyltransferase